jgi:cell division protein ZapE
MTTPWQRYQSDLQRENFSHDPAQEQAVILLQDLYERLVASSRKHDGGLLRWVRKLRGADIAPQVGLYFWGGVGRGKTYLMDTFFDCLPFRRKLRVHFHRFMQRVHADHCKPFRRKKSPWRVLLSDCRRKRASCASMSFL